MLVEAFPRLAIRLRSTFPDAQIDLVPGQGGQTDGLHVSFPAFPAWQVRVSGSPCHEQFQVIESTIELDYDCLRDVPESDFHRLISAENLGLRGATLIADKKRGRRAISIRSSYIAQKGRTRDEAENIAIDVLSILRFARLLEDRILRSVGGDCFSYEMYYSQYLSKSIGRNRFINYARSIFQGSTERVFGQVAGMLKDEYKYKVSMNVQSSRHFVATLIPPNSELEIVLRIPEEIPMLTCSTPLHTCAWEAERSFDLVARLNTQTKLGHFEVNADGSMISFVCWKHLTNDLRYYSLDHLIVAVHEAERILKAELPVVQPISKERQKDRASALDAYRAAA